MEGPPPPEVTISDPKAPLGQVDLLAGGSDRPPWRPSARLVRTVVLAAVVSALVAVVALQVSQRRDERSFDRAAVAGVRIATDLTQGPIDVPDGWFALALRNDGRLPVRVTEATLELPGYAASPLDLGLSAGEQRDVTLPDTARCGRALLQPAPATHLRLAVITARGQRVVREALVDRSTAEFIRNVARFRCGDLQPRDAFSGWVSNAHTVGRTAVLTLQIGNDSALPLTLLRWSTPPGFALTYSGLPRVLPPKSDPRADTVSRAFQVRLRVTDCALARAGPGPGQPPSELQIEAVLAGADGDQVATVPVAHFGAPGEPAELPEVLRRLLSC